MQERFERAVKQTVANKQTASDVLTANLVKDVWTSVTGGLKADLDSRRKTDPGGSAPDPGDSAPDQPHKCADEVSFMPPNVDATSEGNNPQVPGPGACDD